MVVDLYYIPGAQPAPYIAPGRPFVLDGVQYPGNWLSLALAEDLAAIGAAEVITEGEHGDPRYFTTAEDFDGPLRRLVMTPRPLDDIKAELVSLAKADAGARLTPTDWKVIRSVEGVKPMDEATATYRAAIREASNVYEAAVLLCENVEELAKVPAPAWPQ